MGRNDVDEVMSYFAENLTLHVGPYAPVSGHEAIRKTVEGYFSGGICVDHEILYLATAGDVVLMERIDHWIINGKKLDYTAHGGLRGEGPKNHRLARVLHPHPVTPKLETPGQKLGRTPRAHATARTANWRNWAVGQRTAAGEGWVSESPAHSERADSGSCSAATGGRGEAGHPAQDPRCPPGHHLHGAVRAAHRGPRAGGRR